MDKSLTRRVIALAATFCYLGVVTYLALTGNTEALVALIATGGIVMGFYFGVKSKGL